MIIRQIKHSFTTVFSIISKINIWTERTLLVPWFCILVCSETSKWTEMFFIKSVIFMLLLFVSHGISLQRDKRFVVFPRGGSFKCVIGIGVPLKLGIKQSMAIGWNFQMQYSLATNVTQLQQYPPDYDKRSRREREVKEPDRLLFYKGLEDALNGAGLDGRECILRSICENASDSLEHDHNGLYGLLFHIVFTPNYGDGEEDPDMDPVYFEAQKAGKYGVECHTLYPKCTLEDGLLGLFSIMDYGFG